MSPIEVSITFDFLEIENHCCYSKNGARYSVEYFDGLIFRTNNHMKSTWKCPPWQQYHFSVNTNILNSFFKTSISMQLKKCAQYLIKSEKCWQKFAKISNHLKFQNSVKNCSNILCCQWILNKFCPTSLIFLFVSAFIFLVLGFFMLWSICIFVIQVRIFISFEFFQN